MHRQKMILFFFCYLKAYYLLLLHSLTLVPDCSRTSWADPVVQHGCQAGGTEGPGQRVPWHHLRPRVHQPGWHLPAHTDGGEWDWVSLSISFSALDFLRHCCVLSLNFLFLYDGFDWENREQLEGWCKILQECISDEFCTHAGLRSVSFQRVFGVALCILIG